MLEGRWTSRDRIEYQFVAFESVVLLFMEVKLKTGSSVERMNAIAQLIAECDGEQFIPLCLLVDSIPTQLATMPTYVKGLISQSTAFYAKGGISNYLSLRAALLHKTYQHSAAV